MRHGKRKALDKNNAADALIEPVEHLKVSVRAKVEHPFRVSLRTNTVQLVTLFALSNLWMVRRRRLQAAG